MKENAGHKHYRGFKWRKMCVMKIIPYCIILITDLSLVRKTNILLWVCKTGKVYILHARHTFPLAGYIFFEHKIFWFYIL